VGALILWGSIVETHAVYGVSGTIRSDCLRRFSDEWAEPTGDEIKAALSMAGWTGVELSRRVGVDPRTVRRWTGDEKSMPYAAWCVLCAQAGLGSIWV